MPPTWRGGWWRSRLGGWCRTMAKRRREVSASASAPSCANCRYRVEMSADGTWNGDLVARCFYWEPLVSSDSYLWRVMRSEPCDHWRALPDDEALKRKGLAAMTQREWLAWEHRALEVIAR